ncbi:long-chain-fatty-acid--CoA ligase [bacterium]|nr:long-chain-fatty-acid--CoA ligase [bacterium]
MNVGRFLSVSAAKYPDKTALIQGDRKVSYRRFNNRVNRLANKLLGLGVKKGDKASLYFHNSIEWAEIYFALSKIGAVAVPINFRLKGDELAYIVGNSDTKILFFGTDLRHNIEAVKKDLPQTEAFILVGDDRTGGYLCYETLFRNGSTEETGVYVSEDDIHSICYTSGTTGRPKGAVLTHINVIVGHYLNNPVEFGMGHDDITLATTPFSQRIGWAKIVTSASLGSTLAILPSFDAEKALKMVEKEKVTHMSIVPTIGKLILQLPDFESFDTCSLKNFIVSGEAFPTELKQRLKEKFPHVEQISAYASTEAGQITTMTSEDMLRKPDSVGCPIPSVDVKIVDDDGEEVAHGKPGEIAVRTWRPGMFGVMKEYYKDPEYTGNQFLGDFMRTGDIGRLDDDGYLYVVDRKKDMIVSGGFNIYGREVEMVLESHSDVSEVAVIGVPDEKYGEAVKAYVVLKKGAAAKEEELIEYCRTKLASYKKPKTIEFIDALPRNAGGKVLKYKLKPGQDDGIPGIHRV